MLPNAGHLSFKYLAVKTIAVLFIVELLQLNVEILTNLPMRILKMGVFAALKREPFEPVR